jgi:hypothetical protein
MTGEAGRSYARIYERLQRSKEHRAIESAVDRSGGRVVTSTGPSRGPLFLGIEDEDGRPFSLCVYAFTATRVRTRNRPLDEHRFQIRYGDVNKEEWRSEDHRVGFDPLGVDTTLVIGVHRDLDLMVAVDPLLYDPLPMGISVFFKDQEVDAMLEHGWHVWERDNIKGARRASRRSVGGLETLVAFRPEHLMRFARFESTAQHLGLDPSLRFRAAEKATEIGGAAGSHALEAQFDLSSAEILDIISERPRLGVAVRGGVAERHLERALREDPAVSELELDESDGPPDFNMRLEGIGEKISVECKNASPRTYADGTPKVETQKTRASKGNPKSRLYAPDQFDLLAACMFGPTGSWKFRYKRSDRLARDSEFDERIAPIQKIDASWSRTPSEAMRPA